MDSKILSKCCLGVLLAGFGMTWGVTVRAQSLAQMYAGAQGRDPAVGAAQAQLDGAVQRRRQARAQLFPSLGYSASATQTNYDQHQVPDRNFSSQQWSLQLSQPLYKPAAWRSLNQSESQELAAEAQLRAVEMDLVVKVATAYFDALAAEESLRAARSQREAARQQLAIAKRSFDVGTVSVTDVREAEAKYDLGTAQELAADEDVQLKRGLLAQQSGVEVTQLLPVPEDFSGLAGKQPELETWMQLAEDSSPQIVQARYLLEAAEQEVSRARAGHLPTVDLSANYGNNRSGGTVTSPFPTYGRTAQATVTLNVPLFAGMGVDARVKEAVAGKEKARHDLSAARDGASIAIRQAYHGMRSALRQVTAMETARKSSRTSLQANQRGYAVGVRTTADVLNAQSQMIQSEKDLMRARLDVCSNFVKLRSVSGTFVAVDFAYCEPSSIRPGL